jgi:Rod binding domain-containing protein
MEPLRLETLSLKPQSGTEKSRSKAEKVAGQFEAVFVKTLVSSLRQTASIGGEEGGMFGQGPGAETYAGWFDENVSDELSRTGGIGIASALLSEMERGGKIAKDPESVQKKAKKQADHIERLVNGHDLKVTMAKNKGGFNVVL